MLKAMNEVLKATSNKKIGNFEVMFNIENDNLVSYYYKGSRLFKVNHDNKTFKMITWGICTKWHEKVRDNYYSHFINNGYKQVNVI